MNILAIILALLFQCRTISPHAGVPASVPVAPPSRSGVLFGADFHSGITIPGAMETWLGKRMATASLGWSNFGAVSQPALDRWTFMWNAGFVPIFRSRIKENIAATCGCTGSPGGFDRWIADGNYDRQINAGLAGLKGWLAGPDGVYGNSDDRRAFLSFCAEQNGTWFATGVGVNGNTNSSYIAMWIHFFNLVRISNGIGSNHVQLIWNPNIGKDAPDTYPGDAYVNWISFDGYANAGQTASQVFGASISAMRAIAPDKPYAITETGMCTSVARGCGAITSVATVAQKAAYISDLYSRFIPANPFIKMVQWFNASGGDGDWIVFGCDAGAYPRGVGCPDGDGCTNPNGDGTQTIGGIRYKFYTEFKTAVSRSLYMGTDQSNPRLLTDSQFSGGG